MTITAPNVAREIVCVDVLVRQRDVGAAVLAQRAQDRAERARAVELLPGLARRDERLEVPEQELRVDRLAVEALAERARPASARAPPSTFTPSGIFVPGFALRACATAFFA